MIFLGNSTLPGQHSDIASRVDSLYMFIFWCSLAIFAVVVIGIIYFVLKYRSESVRDTLEPQVSHNSKIEFLWTLIPTILIIIVFFWGASDYVDIKEERANSKEILVTASNYKFEFTYDVPKAGIVFSVQDSLVIPQGKNIQLTMTGEKSSYIHSLYIPAFRLKQDVITGINSYLYFKSDDVGTYDYYCAEYCGIGHSGMNGHVVVMPPNAEKFEDSITQNGIYDDWDSFEDVNENGVYDDGEPITESKNGKYDEGELFDDSNNNGVWDTGYDYWIDRRVVKNNANEKLIGAPRGEWLYEKLGCAGCHSIDGSTGIGPTFKGLYGNIQPNGKDKVDDNYIIESIKYPARQIRQPYGNQMPKDYENLETKDITGLVQYIKTLK